MTFQTRRPGDFTAFCKLVERKPVSECTPEEFATATASGIESTWDPKLKCEVLTVQCDERFEGAEDRARLEAHMRSQHPKRIKIWEPGGCGPSYGKAALANHTPRMRIPVALWTSPRIPDEGKALPKAAAEQLRVCPTCDLHGQVDTNAGALWWDEHVRCCALAAAS